MTEQKKADDFRQTCYAYYMGMFDLDDETTRELATQCFSTPPPEELECAFLKQCVAIKYVADEFRRRNRTIPSNVLTMLTILKERDVRAG